MISEITAKIKRMWMRKLLTWKSRKPPAHKRTRTIARIKNMKMPPYLRLTADTWNNNPT
jgi:hypothetical protein